MPTVLVIVDDNLDTSIFFSISEEEEKGSEKDMTIKVYLSEINIDYPELVAHSAGISLLYFYKNYTKPHLNIISPPPDLNIS